MRLAKTLGITGALLTAALIGGTLIGSVAATDEGGDSNPLDADATAYCDVFMDTLASELDTTRDALVAAGRAAANAAIDAALEAGDISEERAASLRERVAESDGEGCGWLGPRLGRGGHGPGHGVHGFIRANALDAAADALGVTSSELLGELREAGSLEAVVTERGASYEEVKAAVLADVQAQLDAAVVDGTIEQERADAVVERLTTWLDDGGEIRGRVHRDSDDTSEDADE